MVCEAFKMSKGESSFNQHNYQGGDDIGTQSVNCRDYFDDIEHDERGNPIIVDMGGSKTAKSVPVDLNAPTKEYEYVVPKFSKEKHTVINGRRIGKIHLCKYHAAKLLDIQE